MTIEVNNLSFDKENRKILNSGTTFSSYGIPINFEVKGEELEKNINFSFTCLFNKDKDSSVAEFESPKKEELHIRFYNPGIV